ncbi:MAG: hypothetical protein JW829_13345, partial [Pirellulales bacterium]|nr:hypothetical protein [Pirellulales bacterium]
QLTQVLDDYGVDGLFNDAGYVRLAGNPKPPTSDEVLAFDEGAKADGTKVDGAITDMLGLLYAEVKRRGGIMKLHCKPLFGRPLMELKLYDYLFTGECVNCGDKLRKATKNSAPYVVPCLDMGRAKIANEDELYLHSIPYMQFPLLLAGRPFTGQRASVPGIDYKDCFFKQHCHAIWKYYQEHPKGPYTYAWWDSVPGRPEARPTHAKWLRQYRPLVEEGTWAWLEVSDSRLFTQPLPRDVVASVFANRRLYIVLANYGQTPATIQSTLECGCLFPKAGSPKTHWDIPARSLLILQHTFS